MTSAADWYSLSQLHTLNIIAYVTGAPSIVGCVFVIYCYYQFKDLRNHAFTLVLYMSICDLIASISRMLGDAGNISPTVCTLQATTSSFFEASSVLWSFLIAFTLHMAFLKEQESFSSRTIGGHMWKYHALGWGYPLLMTALPFTTNSYGDTGAWCWIVKDDNAGVAWRYVQFYGILWITILYCVFVYVRVLMKIKSMGASNIEESKANRKLMRRIMYYPCVLIVCWWAGSVNRLAELFSGKGVYGLAVCHAICSGLFGSLNALVYGLTPVVKSHLKNQLCGGREELSEESGHGEGGSQVETPHVKNIDR